MRKHRVNFKVDIEVDIAKGYFMPYGTIKMGNIHNDDVEQILGWLQMWLNTKIAVEGGEYPLCKNETYSFEEELV